MDQIQVKIKKMIEISLGKFIKDTLPNLLEHLISKSLESALRRIIPNLSS